MSSDFRSVVYNYNQVRQAARDITTRVWISKFPNLSIQPINDSYASLAENIWDHKYPYPDTFDWSGINEDFKKYTRRIDVSIWNDSVLCGLAMGKASKSRNMDDSNVTLCFIQGSPKGVNTLKGSVAPIALDVMSYFGMALDKKVLYIRDPLPGAMEYYTSLDFKLAQKGKNAVYLKKDI